METSATGIIFDLQRCSMYDGPGIRTTVFLKGCPLNCKWCHNPESQCSHPQLAFYPANCTLCGRCSRLCPDVHKIQNNLHQVDFSLCKQACMVHSKNCEAICPSGALKIIGKAVTRDEIIEIAKKDILYYEQTGGGLTISGGEPFSQYPFLEALLTAAKAAKIHTCVETCGYTSQKLLAQSSPYIDLFLFDYKVTSPRLHKEFTGADNQQILNNLEYLYHQNKKIILRCPIIPGYNDTKEHFHGIARMEQKFPHLAAIEIMPYHSLGREKAAAIGGNYQVKAPTADDAIKSNWKEQLKRSGCSQAVVDSF